MQLASFLKHITAWYKQIYIALCTQLVYTMLKYSFKLLGNKMRTLATFVEDFKIEGVWQEYVYAGKNCRIPTRSFSTHSAMTNRVGKLKNYLDCSISEEFKDFQFFVGWCQKQVGYLEEDEFGKRWSLDKDILVKGNRVYSRQTCCFVPSVINIHIGKMPHRQNGLPVGVSSQREGQFKAMCMIAGVNKFAGVFNTKEEAFENYAKIKESGIRARAFEFQDKIDKKVFLALMHWKLEMFDTYSL